MSQGRQIRRNEYIEGNVARRLNERIEQQEPSVRILERVNGENKRARKMGMSFGCVLYIGLLFGTLCFAVISFLNIKAECDATRDRVEHSKVYLNQLNVENNDEYSKMTDEIDIEAIKEIAIKELGMTYPTEEQIITYKREKSDYVRQVADISG